MPLILCHSCANKDSAFVLHGAKYVEEPICVYGMTLFPVTKQCEKYEPQAIEEDIECR